MLNLISIYLPSYFIIFIFSYSKYLGSVLDKKSQDKVGFISCTRIWKDSSDLKDSWKIFTDVQQMDWFFSSRWFESFTLKNSGNSDSTGST